jgi:type I restriction enzyme S subunit
MSQIQLPPHWKVLPLREVGRIERGKFTDRPRNDPEFYGGNIPFIQTGDVANSDGYIRTYSQTLNEKGLSVSRIFAKGTIVITIAANIGHTGILEFDSAFPDSLIGITPFENIDKDYLNYYLRTQQAELDRQAPRGTQKNINIQFLHPWAVVVPPLPEQFAIAHTLRTIQKAKEARQRQLKLERERKAALMQYLFTHGTRNEPRKQTEIGEIPQSWLVVKLGKVCKFLQYGTSKKCDLDSSGLPVLRIPNVIGGKIDTGDLKFVKLSSNEAESLMLKLGDLLFVRTNGRREYTGRCAVFSGEPQEALFASYLIRARLDTENLLPEFAQFYSMTYQGKKYLSERASSASDGKFNINTQTIKSVLIPKPDIDEQREIINAFQASNRKITALEQETTFLDELFRAMLEELMTGRLSALPLLEEKAFT